MSTYLVTRHRGALQWIQAIGQHYDKHLTHLDGYEHLKPGDKIIGSLPINIVADINALNVSYIHLSLNIPANLRGIELTSEQLGVLQAKLEMFEVNRIDRSQDIEHIEPL